MMKPHILLEITARRMRTSITALLVLCSLPALGAEGLYLGAGAGVSYLQATAYENRLTRQVQAVQGAGGSAEYSIDNYDFAGALRLGYQLSNVWGVELGYASLGTTRVIYEASVRDIYGERWEHREDTLSTTWFSAAATGALSLTGDLDLLAKVGVAQWRLREKVRPECRHSNPASSYCALFAAEEKNAVYHAASPLLGLGLRYRYSRKIAIDLQWDYINDLEGLSQIGSLDGNALSVALDYAFFPLTAETPLPVVWDKLGTYLGIGYSYNTLRGYNAGGGYQLFGGYDLPLLSPGYGVMLELGYLYTDPLQPTAKNGAAEEASAYGLWLTAVGRAKIAKAWHGLLRAGFDTGNDRGPLAGLGVQYDLNRTYALTLETVRRPQLQSVQLQLKFNLGRDGLSDHGRF